MQNEYVKVALMAAWVVAASVLGYVSGTTSVAGWTGVAVLSLVPPAVMAQFWSEPSPSTSEAIRDVLR